LSVNILNSRSKMYARRCNTPPRWLTKRLAFSRALPREISGRHGRVDHDRAGLTCGRSWRDASPRRVLIRLPDPDIVAKAAQEQRVVLTFDLDFGDILAVTRTETPSVIIFRLRNQTPAAVNPRLFRVISDCESNWQVARSSSLRTRDIASGDCRFDAQGFGRSLQAITGTERR